jgi:uncharacterized lipoprotein YddW (UPF0748 family)
MRGKELDGSAATAYKQALKAIARKASALALFAFLSFSTASANLQSAGQGLGQAQKPASEVHAHQRFKGIFVGMNSLEAYENDPNLGRAISKISSTGFNVVEVEAVGAYGSAFYRSGIVPMKQSYFKHFADGDDPLKDVIREASKRNLKVWAWVHPFTGNHILYNEHPGWFAVDSYGSKSHRYLDFMNPHVRAYTFSMLKELASNYKISGINLDIELPRDMVSYSKKDLSMFAEDNNLRGVTAASVSDGRYSAMWDAWTEKMLYDFLAKCYSSLKKGDPGLVISYDVVPNPFYWYYYNDWLQILKRKSADVIEPMLYWRDYGYPESMIKGITEYDISLMKSMKSKSRIMAIIGGNMRTTYDVSGREWVRALSEAGKGGSKDVAVFAYECIKRRGAWSGIKKYLIKEKKRDKQTLLAADGVHAGNK